MSQTNRPVPRMLDYRGEGKRTWTGRMLSPVDWAVPLPLEALAELGQLLAGLLRLLIEIFLLDPADYELAPCRHHGARSI